MLLNIFLVTVVSDMHDSWVYIYIYIACAGPGSLPLVNIAWGRGIGETWRRSDGQTDVRIIIGLGKLNVSRALKVKYSSRYSRETDLKNAVILVYMTVHVVAMTHHCPASIYSRLHTPYQVEAAHEDEGFAAIQLTVNSDGNQCWFVFIHTWTWRDQPIRVYNCIGTGTVYDKVRTQSCHVQFTNCACMFYRLSFSFCRCLVIQTMCAYWENIAISASLVAIRT